MSSSPAPSSSRPAPPTPQRLIYDAPVALIGGGELDAEAFALACGAATAVIAADSGADAYAALSAAASPAPSLAAVIGDMDSIANLEDWRRRGDVRVVALDEQDTTDLEKCLYTVGAPLYLAAGFLGRRADHSLAALHVLLRRRAQRIILIGAEDVLFLSPPRLALELTPGARVSLFPLAKATALSSSGLVWPLDGLTFELGRQSGTSNAAAAASVRATFDAPGVLVILERRWLGAAIAALTGSAEQAASGWAASGWAAPDEPEAGETA